MSGVQLFILLFFFGMMSPEHVTDEGLSDNMQQMSDNLLLIGFMHLCV